MSSFTTGVIQRQVLSQDLLQTVRLIGEYKGKQELFKEQSPQLLNTLRQVAVIQSVESSNRIEGIEVSPQRLRRLVANKATPEGRSEREILGYREVLQTIHANHAGMRVTPGLLLQLHRDLTQFLPLQGGVWKLSDNTIAQVLADGTQMIRFRPVAAHRVPAAMEQLHVRFDEVWQKAEVEPLLAIASYVLDFLCIHPFADGNGRMARLLTLLLLYRAGYEVGRYISLEQAIERTKESYYDTLYRSSQGWHESEHSLLPWWDYFLGVVLAAYRDFEQRVGTMSSARGAKRKAVVEAIARLPQQFQIKDLERACPGVSRPTLNRVLADIRKSGKIQCVKAGRDAVWEKLES